VRDDASFSRNNPEEQHATSHGGFAVGAAGMIVYLVAALAVPFLFGSGAYLYVHRRRQVRAVRLEKMRAAVSGN
jgi:uncharacterized iron-regulated membrane protein